VVSVSDPSEPQPWRRSEDVPSRPAFARGSGKKRPLAVSLMLDLDAEQSAWLRREAERSGQDYDSILKDLLDRERAARP
jgi:hypothetical protein